MMKKYIKFKLILLVLIVMTTACTDEGTDGFDIDVFPELERGGFIRFPDGEIPPATLSFVDPQAAAITFNLEDFNGNAASYNLDVTATISGTDYLIEDFQVITSFPAQMTIDVEEIAIAAGLTLDDVNFGDSFAFLATVTTTDGREFIGQEPTLDEDTGIILPGNTEGQLLTNPGSYNSAMRFGFTLACPAFTAADVVGEYDVVTLGFAGFFGETDFTRTVIAGPAENQITIVGGEFTSQGSDDLILTVDFTTGAVTGVNTDGFVFDLPPENFYLLVDGLVLPCSGTGVIDLRMNFNPLSGNPHDFILVRQ